MRIASARSSTGTASAGLAFGHLHLGEVSERESDGWVARPVDRLLDRERLTLQPQRFLVLAAREGQST